MSRKHRERKRETAPLGISGSHWQADLTEQRVARASLVLKRAGLPRVKFHDLRHTFATLALQNGVDVKMVSKIGAHPRHLRPCDHGIPSPGGKNHVKFILPVAFKLDWARLPCPTSGEQLKNLYELWIGSGGNSFIKADLQRLRLRIFPACVT